MHRRQARRHCLRRAHPWCRFGGSGCCQQIVQYQQNLSDTRRPNAGRRTSEHTEPALANDSHRSDISDHTDQYPANQQQQKRPELNGSNAIRWSSQFHRFRRPMAARQMQSLAYGGRKAQLALRRAVRRRTRIFHTR